MISADGGACQGQLSVQWKDGAQAAQPLLRGEVRLAASGQLRDMFARQNVAWRGA